MTDRNSQPDPPALSPDSGERYTEADLTTEASRRSHMLGSGEKKQYTAEEFHRELAARLVEQARREREAADRKSQKELLARFDLLADKVDKANNLKQEIGTKVDRVEVKVNDLANQGAAASKAFGIDKMSADDMAAAPYVFRQYQDHARSRASGLWQWQKAGIIVGILVGLVVACASLYNLFLGVAHPLGHA